MFIAMRMLSGAAGASVQAVGAGTIADVWEVKERGHAMGIFYLGPLCGPLLSPIIGGALNEGFGWRAVQWFLAIMGAVIFTLVLFCLPETLKERRNVTAIEDDGAAPQIAPAGDEKNGATADTAVQPTLTRTTTRQSVHVKTTKYLAFLKRAFIDPLRIILYLQFPAVAICVFYATTTFAALYSLNVSIQQTFSTKPYNYTSIIVGLLYIPNSLGYFLTSIFGGKWVDRIMAREARKAGRYDHKHRLQYRPEDRMKENAWLGAFMFPAALVVYGWTAEYGVNIAAPMIANFFFGIGSMLIFAMVTTMLTEFMPRKGSHGVALNNFVRNIFSCVGAAVTEPLMVAIGNGWLFTGFAVISIASGVYSIWAMKKYGDRWRVRMDAKMDKVMGD
jgi:MFS family permease